VRILFLMRHATYLRHYETIVRRLAERGHCIHLGVSQRTPPKMENELHAVRDRLLEAFPTISFGGMPRRDDEWARCLHYSRMVRSLLRYYDPLYAHAHKLRSRFEQRLPWTSARLRRSGLAKSALARRAFSKLLSWIDRSIPSDPAIESAIMKHRPDLVMATPLLQWNSPHFDYLRSARKLGIRSVYCVASWDNLTNKGLVHVPPDFTVLWNEAQKKEAVELHGLAPERVFVTGSQSFDHWFDKAPSTDRESFCRQVGFDPARPFVLYLCSSGFIARKEVGFIDEWIGRLRRSSSSVLRSAQVLVRPHPQNTGQWRDADLSRHEAVAVWPREGKMPVDADGRSVFFDSMHHSAAVVGLNTSAMIEAGIVGRRSLTVLTPEFRDTQEGTIHFSHLTRDDFLVCSPNFDDHFAQLERQIAGDPTSATTIRRFLESFVRPNGLDKPAAPQVVAAIESAATKAPLPDDSLGVVGAPFRRLIQIALGSWSPIPAIECSKTSTVAKHVPAEWLEPSDDEETKPRKEKKPAKAKKQKPPKARKSKSD
jgi:hypothetical protein